MTATSLSLLERLRSSGDEAAWRRFVALYTPLLTSWARQAGMSEDDAADLVQDVLTKLTSQLPTFSYDPNRKNFRGWLKTITFNACRDRQRRPKAADGQSTLLSELADDSALSELWEAEFQRNLVNHALRIMKTDFNETTWKACWETAVEGRAAKDVAAELGMTEPAVYMAKSRVLRRLRDELKELLE